MSKLTVGDCKRIMSAGRMELSAAQKRIDELESLVRDMYAVIGVHERRWRDDGGFTAHENFEQRMAELGIETEGGA